MRKYVLSVDSKGITGLEIEKMLKNPDVHVMNVRDAEKAEAAVRNKIRDYNLIIWTVNTGEEHSYNVIKNLMAKGVFKDIPLIVVSDRTQKGEVIKALESGAVYYIMRPYDESVLDKISGFLGINPDKPFKSMRNSIVVFTFDDIFEKEIKSASRGGYPVSLLLFSIKEKDTDRELDREKTEVLAAVFKRRLRDSDIVIRTDTGKIFIILPFAGKAGLVTVENKVKELLEKHSVIRKIIDGCYAYMSSVTYPDDAKTGEELLEKLKKRMEKVCTSGKTDYENN